MRKYLYILAVAGLLLAAKTAVAQFGSPTDVPTGDTPPVNMMPPGGSSFPVPPTGMMPQIPKMMPPSGQEGDGQVPPNMPQQFGPNTQGQAMMGDDKAAEMQAKGEAMRKQGQKKGLEQMKKGLSQFGKQLTKIKNRINVLKTKGVQPSEEMNTALTQVEEFMAKLNTAEDMESIQDDMDNFQEASQTLAEGVGEMEKLAQFPKVLSKAKLELKKLNTTLKRAQTQAAKSKIDVSDIIQAFSAQISTLNQALADADALFKASKAEEAFDKLSTDFFDKIGDAYEEFNKIQAITNFAKYAGEVKRGLAQAKAQVRALERKKIDATELKSIISQSEQKYEGLKQLLAVKPLDIDAVETALDELENLRSDFSNKFEELTGTSDVLPGMQPVTQPKLDLGFVGSLMPKVAGATTQK
ncbi:MAG: hypothetical protein HY973_00610 [Candidatus Kerfeldbacteria bacterium]|nr:hypothetical protein [Candidatus Kerfeldbacteria bacterium]